MRPLARCFGLVVLGNGSAGITRPGTRTAPIQGTGKPPLEAPGRNPSRAQVASLPRKAPGISSKKDH